MKVKMKSIKNVAKAFLKDESGQSTTEYVLLLVFVVMAVKTVGKNLTSGLSGLIDTAMGKAKEGVESAGAGN